MKLPDTSKMYTPPHPSEQLWHEYREPYLALSQEEQALARIGNWEIYQRYKLAETYGKQLYNIVGSSS